MSRAYRLLIIGRHTPKHTWKFEDSQEIWEFLSISLLEEFKKLSHVTTNIVHVHHPKRDNDLEYFKLPEVDCIIFCGLPTTFEQLDLVKLKEATKYKKMVSFLERGLGSSAIDWTFEFKNGGTSNTTFIPGPVNKKLYKNVEKEPKSILLDHCYCFGTICLLHSMEAWLEPLKDEYKIYRLVRPDEKSPTIPSYIIPIKETTFNEYLELVGKMETWVCTHCESLGFWTYDAMAQKINLIAPTNFLCQKGLIDAFELQTFSAKDEFLNLIKKPIDQTILQKRIDKMTDYSKIIEIIDKKFRNFLLRDDRIERENNLKELKLEFDETEK